MPKDQVDRRLAAIFAGDIAGYSRLMGADEEGTLRQLKAHRKELVDPKITEHRGRIVKRTRRLGSTIVVTFRSEVRGVPEAQVIVPLEEYLAQVQSYFYQTPARPGTRRQLPGSA